MRGVANGKTSSAEDEHERPLDSDETEREVEGKESLLSDSVGA